MHFISSITMLALLGLSNAASTVTISINTGFCPASYSASLATSYSSMPSAAGTAAGSSPSGYSRTPCPAQFGTPYSNGGGSNYQLFCNSAIVGSDLSAVDADSLENCMTQCDSYVPPSPDTQYNGSYCVAVTYYAMDVPSGNCQLKYNVTTVQVLSSPADSAKLAGFAVAPAVSSSIESVITGSATASVLPSTVTIPAPGTTSSNPGSNPTSSPAASSTPSGAAPSSQPTGAASTSTSSTAAATSITISPPPTSTVNPSSPSGVPAPCPCPADNNQTVYDTLGYDFQVYCDESFQLLQGPGSILASSLDECMLACDQYVDDQTYAACSGAAYMPGDPENGLNCLLTTDSDPYTVNEVGACVALVPDGEQ